MTSQPTVFVLLIKPPDFSFKYRRGQVPWQTNNRDCPSYPLAEPDVGEYQSRLPHKFYVKSRSSKNLCAFSDKDRMLDTSQP
jgi:hypothetical protein